MGARNGFVAVRSLNGKRPTLQLYPVKPDATNAYFQGDPVALNTAGQAIICTAAVSANYLGVIDSVYAETDPFSAPRALTFSQPSGGPYLATAQTGWALVNVDNEQVYQVQLDVTASMGLVGQSCGVSAGVPNTRAGISGFNLKGSTLGTDAEKFAQIVGISPFEVAQLGRGVDYPAGSSVLVRINTTRVFPLV